MRSTIKFNRLVALEKQASAALLKGDLAEVERINRDEGLMSANIQFVVKNGKLNISSLNTEKPRQRV